MSNNFPVRRTRGDRPRYQYDHHQQLHNSLHNHHHYNNTDYHNNNLEGHRNDPHHYYPHHQYPSSSHSSSCSSSIVSPSLSSCVTLCDKDHENDSHLSNSVLSHLPNKDSTLRYPPRPLDSISSINVCSSSPHVRQSVTSLLTPSQLGVDLLTLKDSQNGHSSGGALCSNGSLVHESARTVSVDSLVSSPLHAVAVSSRDARGSHPTASYYRPQHQFQPSDSALSYLGITKYPPPPQDFMPQQAEPSSAFKSATNSNDFLEWAKTEDPEYVANAFAKDPNLQWSVDQCGNNLFHGGCEVGNISLISYLLKKLPDGDVERLLGSFNRQGLKPFHVAVSSGMCHIIKLLSKFSPQLAQETTRDGSTALHLAVQANCRAALSFLVSVLDQDFIWSRDACGATPLHLACVEGSAALVLDLLRVPGANVNVLDGQGQSCLHIAVILGHFKLCKTLLSLEHPMKALIEQPCRQGNTALHYACSNQQYSIVKLLLEHGANAQARNKMKLTPAQLTCNDEVIDVLIRISGQFAPLHKGQVLEDEVCFFGTTTESSGSVSGLDSEADELNDDGTSSDDDESEDDDDDDEEAVGESEDEETKSEFVEETEGNQCSDEVEEDSKADIKDADVSCDNISDSVLFKMIKSGGNIPELESVIGSAQSRLKRNVNLIRDSESGGTLLHLAAEYGHLDTVQFLVEGAGAEVDCQDDHGMTPLHCAVESLQLLVVRYLVKYCGAKLDIKNINGDLALDLAHENDLDDDENAGVIARILERASNKSPARRRLVNIPSVSLSLK